MEQLKDHLEWMAGAIRSGEISLRDYRRAMREMKAPLVDVLANLPLMLQTLGAEPDVVARVHEARSEILGEFSRLLDEEPAR